MSAESVPVEVWFPRVDGHYVTAGGELTDLLEAAEAFLTVDRARIFLEAWDLDSDGVVYEPGTIQTWREL